MPRPHKPVIREERPCEQNEPLSAGSVLLLEMLEEALRVERAQVELRHHALLKQLAVCSVGEGARTDAKAPAVGDVWLAPAIAADTIVSDVEEAPKEGLEPLAEDGDLHQEEDEMIRNQVKRETAIRVRQARKSTKSQIVAGVWQAIQGDEPGEHITWHPKTWVMNPSFDGFFCALIVLNTVVMALDVQYRSLDYGYEIGFPRHDDPAIKVLPGASDFFSIAETIFGSLFTLEIILKMIGLGWSFFLDWWNLFDSCIVIAWIVDTILSSEMVNMPIEPMILRLARLARLMRLLRLVRTIKGFDALYILTTALKGSMSILLWAFVLLFLLQALLGFFMNQIVMGLMEDTDYLSNEAKLALFAYFGSSTRSVLTMFELSLANWPPVARLLQDELSEWFVIFSIVHKVTMGFAVIGVVNGVFMQETFKVASQDDAVMMRQSESKRNNHIMKMEALFDIADKSGDGLLSAAEFAELVQSKQVRTWLAAQEFQVALMDPADLFHLLAGEDDMISAEEFVDGITRLKGGARSADLRWLMYKHDQLLRQLNLFPNPTT